MKLKLTNSEVVVNDKGEHLELWSFQTLVPKVQAEVLRKKMSKDYELETKP